MTPASHPTPRRRRFSRRACQDLQALSRNDQRRVRRAFQVLGIDHCNTLTMHGGPRRWRRRLGRLRIIWALDESSDDLLVLRVMWRREDYLDDGRDLIADHDEPCDDESPDGDELDRVEEHQRITYIADDSLSDELAWYAFIYGSYRYRPHLDDAQADLVARIAEPYARHAPQGVTVEVRSGPGTGKSICAAHLAAGLAAEWRQGGVAGQVLFVAPAELVADLARYPQVAGQAGCDRWFLGTYLEWARRLLRDRAELVEPDLELEAFRRAARDKVGEVDRRDLSLYRAFVLDGKNRKDATFEEHRARVARLEQLAPRVFERAVQKLWAERRGRPRRDSLPPLARHQASDLLACEPPALSPGVRRVVLVVDEAQDLFRRDVDAVYAVCDRWRTDGVRTDLLLLGDLNQRVEPTGYTGARFAEQIRFNHNYRNSRRILEFANRVLGLGTRRAATTDTHHPEGGTCPDGAAEVGDPVRVLVVKDADAVADFLRCLDLAAARRRTRELLRRLAQQVKVLSPVDSGHGAGFDNLLLLTAGKAKGREFAACVVVSPFAGEGDLPVDDVFRLYTLLTRAQSRLLLVLTRREYERATAQDPALFGDCDMPDAADSAIMAGCVQWALELNSEVDPGEQRADIEEELLRACERGSPYLDTYEVARQAGLSLAGFESLALDRLIRLDQTALEREFGEAACVSMRCLLMRALRRSWDAAREALALKETEPGECCRLVESVARDLEEGARLPMRMPLEAARIRHAFLGKPLSPQFADLGLEGREGSLPEQLRDHLAQHLRLMIGRMREDSK